VVGGYWLYNRDTQTVQAQEIRDAKQKIDSLESAIEKNRGERDRQLDVINQKMLTKEVFEAYHNNDVQRMERMEKVMERILEK
jgi:hypothetical protein